MRIRGTTGGLDTQPQAWVLGCLCSALYQDYKVNEKRDRSKSDSASMSERRLSLLIDLLADYGDSALIDAGSIPTLKSLKNWVHLVDDPRPRIGP